MGFKSGFKGLMGLEILDRFSTNIKYQISLQSIQWKQNGSMQTDRQTGQLYSTPAPQRTSYFYQTKDKVRLHCNKNKTAQLSLNVTPTFHNTYHILKHKRKSFLRVHYVMQRDNVGMLEFFEQ